MAKIWAPTKAFRSEEVENVLEGKNSVTYVRKKGVIQRKNISMALVAGCRQANSGIRTYLYRDKR